MAEYKKLTFDDIKDNYELKTYIECADKSLSMLGYTEHAFSHVNNVASMVEYILTKHKNSARDIELGKIAAYMHDIGNLVNRVDHSQSGAIMAFRLLDKLGLDPSESAIIMTAIGNHDEGTGVPVSDVAAALILADKCDVRRSRVRNQDINSFDIHDKVNYSVTNALVNVLEEEKTYVLDLTIDTEVSSVMDYFEIFIGRMILCKKAAHHLGWVFRLNINGQRVV